MMNKTIDEQDNQDNRHSNGCIDDDCRRIRLRLRYGW